MENPIEGREKVILLVEELIRVASAHECLLTGFVVSLDAPPLLLHFGNVKEKGPDLSDLHERLCAMTTDGRPVIEKSVQRAN